MENAFSEHRKLILWGMMGSGKTFMSVKLSDSIDIPFLDLDQIIEEKSGCSISELFQRFGESRFRAVEHDLLKEILAFPQSLILALGGGTACFQRNQDLFQPDDLTIYLRCSIPVLMTRLINERDKRPMLADQNDSLDDRIRNLLAERNPWYQKAKIILDVDKPLAYHQLEMIAREYFHT
jgi:shikimate kinase